MILKAYREWGDRVVDHLIGMFAFAIVERDTGRVVLARDRLGIKPLYLAEASKATASRLRFASTLPALVAAGGVDTAIDPVALHHYLTLPLRRARAAHDPARRPQAAAGHALVIEPDGRRTQETYWEPLFERVRRARELVGARLGGRDPRLAAHRRRAPPGRRRAGRGACSPAASTPA